MVTTDVFLSLRKCVSILLGVFGGALILLLIHQVGLPVAGYFFPSLVPVFYDLAVYGAYPTSQYVTFELHGPVPSTVVLDDQCNDGFVLLSPFGPALPDPGPLILDSTGELVWAAKGFGIVMNLKVQQFQHENVLSFWAGDKDGSVGIGSYYMLNSSYDVVHEITAVSTEEAPRMGDMHDFKITDEGTALLTIYDTVQYGLSKMGWSHGGWIVDSLFQEIDLVSGELIFKWRASEHLDPTESLYVNPFGGYKRETAYDFFHINSVDKDKEGNYLISSRHYHSVFCLNSTSSILWTLGGSGNDFQELSNGQATSFRLQHDARWVDEDEGILSLFDNENAGVVMHGKEQSQGLMLKVDTDNMTVRLSQSFESYAGALSTSQGSMQILSDTSHAFVGWGSSAAYSEYTANGTLLCETHITPSILFWWGRVKTYRAIKNFDWVGRPAQSTVARYSKGNIYVSWNGATEVATWQLEGSSTDSWQIVDIHDKIGFEHAFILNPVISRYEGYSVAALDNDERMLAYSTPVNFTAESRQRIWIVSAGCVLIELSVGAIAFIRYKSLSTSFLSMNWTRHGYRKIQNLEMY